eukprot:Seg3913.1 transcript_id=Seg3913.1/GoldUCD/mRNA.D3Y31 product="hypothetical protein" protein_id=Seg3913.1/GoldUCD/D3Y31
MEIWKSILLSILSVIWTHGISSAGEQLKLSSLPQLKKWEIPAMPQKYAMRTGRKFKHIDDVYQMGRKRSSHWSIAPELNFREVDMEEDNEKIKLDQNYKAFLEDDDIPESVGKQGGVELGELNRLSDRKRGNAEKKSNTASKSTLKRISKSGEKRHGISHVNNVQHKSKKTHTFKRKLDNMPGNIAVKQNIIKNKNGKHDEKLSSNKDHIINSKMFLNPRLSAAMISQHSEKNTFYPEDSAKSSLGKGALLDSSEGQGSNSFSTADLKSHVLTASSKPRKLRAVSELVNTRLAHDYERPKSTENTIAKRAAENDVTNDLMTQKRSAVGLNEAVRRARLAMNAIQIKKQAIAKQGLHPGLLKAAALNAAKAAHPGMNELNVHKRMLQKRLQDSKAQAMNLLKNSGLPNKGQNRNGILGDQPTKVTMNRQNNNAQNKIATITSTIVPITKYEPCN